MKSTIFFKSLEYNLEASGEKWRQGEKIKGSLKVKNHGTEGTELPFIKVSLCEGQYKKIKAKDSKGWKKISESSLADKINLNPNEEKTFSFEFTLPEDALITDKNGSLYLAFFDSAEPLPTGHIELVIEPKIVITQILDILQSFLRFKVAQTKYTKGMIEVKLSPPSSREMSTIDSLVLCLAEVDKNLTLHYEFTIKVLDMTGGNMSAQKKTKEMEQKFNSKQYLFYGDSINQDFIIESINNVLNEVKPKFL
jgi:sporulation-control protein spo0M